MSSPSMQGTPFRPKYPSAFALAGAPLREPAPAAPAVPEPAVAAHRIRLGDLDMHLHCSIVGTCLPDAELRKTIGRFAEVLGASELDVHHEAVRLAGTEPQAARALHKALDRRYDVVLRRFAKARDEAEVERLWDEFMRRGEVPGAYWAVLSHRQTTPSLRQHVFGQVHMLSHLMGASTRADLRQRVVLEAENADLRAQNARLQSRHQQLVETHDRAEQAHAQADAELGALRAQLAAATAQPVAVARAVEAEQHASDSIAHQTRRRERAESEAERLVQEGRLLREEIDLLHQRMAQVMDEARAAEAQLRHVLTADEDAAPQGLDLIRGQRLLYVGGRPSSAVAIREFVERCGGEIRRHDGGLEDRKGQLASAIAWADKVLFPVDCIDHDSATNLKRQCLRLGIPFVPLRTAGVASFVAALGGTAQGDDAQAGPGRLCLRHA